MAKETFGANLKMNPAGEKPTESVKSLLRAYVEEGATGNEKREVIVFAPFVFLSDLYSLRMTCLENFPSSNSLRLGAQDVSEYDSGAHTREISPLWLKELGVSDVLVGHSEVRGEYEKLLLEAWGHGKENYDKAALDMVFNRKIRNALTHGLRVTYCVGETKREKEQGLTKEVIKKQLTVGLKNVTGIEDVGELERLLIIAYEPRWAIGTGDIPTRKEIKEAHETVREVMGRMGYQEPDKNLVVMYGGSMKPENVREIMAVPGVNGGLIGNACLDARKFGKIVNYGGGE